MSTGKGYYPTMADVVNSRLSDEMKRELTGLLTTRVADKLWTAFDEGLKTGAIGGSLPSGVLDSTEGAYKAGVLSLAAWMMTELEEAMEGKEAMEDKEDKEGKEEDDGMHICMGLN
jgi:hypothetical protein